MITKKIKSEQVKADNAKEELKTEGPLSEKDEVKQAEERTRKNTDGGGIAVLRNREHEDR